MRCVRCGVRDELPEAVRLAFEADIPTGLCIVCLAKDPVVASTLRVRRERLLRKVNSPAARIEDWIARGVDGVRNLARRFHGPGSRPSATPRQSFERQLAEHGASIGAMTAAVGITEMLGFYRDVRIAGCEPERGDMLLYQWGTYDRAKRKRFELDITRQIVLEGSEDDDIWQLSLTFGFPSNESHQALGSGNKWCQSHPHIDDFGAFVRAHSAYAAVADRTDGVVELTYELAG